MIIPNEHYDILNIGKQFWTVGCAAPHIKHGGIKCPNCGNGTFRPSRRKTKTIYDLYGGHPSKIVFDTVKLTCKKCGEAFEICGDEQLMAAGSRKNEDYLTYIAQRYFTEKEVIELWDYADRYNVGETTLREALKAYSNRLQSIKHALPKDVKELCFVPFYYPDQFAKPALHCAVFMRTEKNADYELFCIRDEYNSVEKETLVDEAVNYASNDDVSVLTTAIPGKKEDGYGVDLSLIADVQSNINVIMDAIREYNAEKKTFWEMKSRILIQQPHYRREAIIQEEGYFLYEEGPDSHLMAKYTSRNYKSIFNRRAFVTLDLLYILLAIAAVSVAILILAFVLKRIGM